MEMIAALVLGYLLGSVPFGLILTRLFGAGDLRDIGSGSIGATNVLRTGSKGLAGATLLLDMAKGFAAVVIAWEVFGFFGRPWEPVCAAGAGALLGHCFPLWLGFRGGKGVATLMGVLLGFAWPISAAYAAVWIGMLVFTRISSLAGMSAAVLAPIAAWVLGYFAFVPVLSGLAVLVLFLHRGNIARLRAGTEPKVGKAK
ncbi:MAG: glycerol-3-phosphate 1-O-acyltransferase PlsY [Sphingomonadaceae bacterium]|nr:glycerol-3-phosphate 1-O-acyltransferase PlsY [Sphingomonadaceae bacterium]